MQRCVSPLVDYDDLNWFPTSKNFYRSPFSKWPPQYRKNSTLFDFKGSFWFIFRPVVSGQFGSLETSQSLDYNNILFILILSCIFTDISMRVQIISCQLSPLDVIYANFVLYFYRYIYESSDNFLSVISLGCYLY